MKRILIIIFTAILCISCSDNETSTSSSSLEATLEKNTSWPYEVIGTLDIVEAGGYEDSDYPSWAVGSIVTADDPDGAMINIGEGVVAKARIDIDSGKPVKAWLGSPKKEYGTLVYPVEKIEAQ